MRPKLVLLCAVVTAILVAVSGTSVGWAATSPVAAGTTQPPGVGPIIIGGGGYTYPPGSPYEALYQWTDQQGIIVPLREGNSQFGYQHMQEKHGMLDPNLVGTAITNGTKTYNSSTGNQNYTIWVYDTNAADFLGIEVVATIIVAANEYKVMEDNFYLGVVTAYCANYYPTCPDWISFGAWTYGGPGNAPRSG